MVIRCFVERLIELVTAFSIDQVAATDIIETVEATVQDFWCRKIMYNICKCCKIMIVCRLREFLFGFFAGRLASPT